MDACGESLLSSMEVEIVWVDLPLISFYWKKKGRQVHEKLRCCAAYLV